jgi:hypothetical protein
MEFRLAATVSDSLARLTRDEQKAIDAACRSVAMKLGLLPPILAP